MLSVIDKEKILYESMLKKNMDKDFFIAFKDYFEHITNDGSVLIATIFKDFQKILEDEKDLEDLFNLFLKDIEDLYAKIVKITIKLKISENQVIKDCVRDIQSFLNSSHMDPEDMFDNLEMEMRDLLQHIRDLGFEKQVSKFFTISKHKPYLIDKVFVFNNDNKRNFLEKSYLLTKFKNTNIAGSLAKLFETYKIIIAHEEVNLSNFKLPLKDKLAGNTQLAKIHEYDSLVLGKIDSGKNTFKKENYVNDLEKLHDYIVLNNQKEEKVDNKIGGEIFYIKDESIHHFEKGKLTYNLVGTKIPKYMKIFMNVISYMPKDRIKIRISEFEKVLPSSARIGKEYRNNIGVAAKSFNYFLKKNGIKNLNPKNKEIIINATDEYIVFNNKM